MRPAQGVPGFAPRCPGVLGTVRNWPDGEIAGLARACAGQERAL